ALADTINTAPSISDEESRRILFGQTAQQVAR
ncbi:MAG TPA: thiol:disulfide oxidoreductase, partial [Achromobacter sp.]|nr:thiol:disulfide oxidoreductase [Achromobacter sp.]